MGRILDIRDKVMKILETKREKDMIGSSLEAKIVMFSPDGKVAAFLKENEGLLPGLFKVSQACVSEKEEADMDEAEGASLKISVRPAEGKKCPRCWNFSETVGQDKEFPELCERCYTVMSKRRGK